MLNENFLSKNHFVNQKIDLFNVYEKERKKCMQFDCLFFCVEPN